MVLFQVRVGGSMLASSPHPMCSNCETAEATIDCSDCEAILCQICSKSIHSGKVYSLHQPVPFSPEKWGVRLFVRCPEHGKLWEFFCVSCKTLVCVNCCIVGYIIYLIILLFSCLFSCKLRTKVH